MPLKYKRDNVTARSNWESEKHNNVTDQITKTSSASVTYASTLTKKDLMDILSYEMHGILRHPALWYNYLNYSMDKLELSRYEVLPDELSHDVSNYTKNIYQDLPSHMANSDWSII